MTPERWRRLKELFGAALDRRVEERAPYLAGECAGDPELLAEVEQLLRAHAETGAFLPDPAPALGVEPAPERIGPYRLVRELGHGGMGTVHLAERVDDEYRKQVAIKVIRAGMDTADVVARFRAERQILASLQHPGIAALLDGGTTADGHPYFVMEHVEGEPLDRYCEGQKLPIAERLRLFQLVCGAVEHAHGRLVVHRDLKPGNILVTAEGQPKLLDFGLAKLLDPGAAAADQTTTQHRFVTPAFASPEQLLGGAITTASDVYSLGALLYLLLSGERAHGSSGSSHEELLRAAREEVPRRPSAAVAEERLRRTLAGDLDAIVLKAMRREPGERYRSVEQLSEDVRRYLEGLPVAARRGGRWYRVRKHARRHGVALAATALVVLALSAAFAETVRERARAERRAEDVRRLAGSVMGELFTAIAAIPGMTQVRVELMQRSKEYLDGLARESRGDLALKRDLAAAYVRLARVQGIEEPASRGDVQGALASMEAAVALYEQAFRANARDAETLDDLAHTLSLVADAKQSAGRADGIEDGKRAVSLAEQATALAPSVLGHRRTLSRSFSSLARFQANADDHQRARDSYRRAAEIIETIPGGERTQADEENLAINYLNLGYDLEHDDPERAETLIRGALAILEPPLADRPSDVRVRTRAAQVRQRLGQILADRLEVAAAVEQYRLALATFQDLAAADPGSTSARTQVAVTQLVMGEALAGGPEPQQALEPLRAASGSFSALSAADPANVWKVYWLGEAEALQGRAEMALAHRSIPAAAEAHWRAARASSARGVEVLDRLEAQGKYHPGMADLKTARDDLATCDAALATARK
jgi:eukaryotic-like serine/threonine-protein kinase